MPRRPPSRARVTDVTLGSILLSGGIAVDFGGMIVSLTGAYRRAEAHGDL